MAVASRWDGTVPTYDFIGLSTEAKPTVDINGNELEDGCTYREVNTGEWYILYKGTWYQQ